MAYHLCRAAQETAENPSQVVGPLLETFRSIFPLSNRENAGTILSHYTVSECSASHFNVFHSAQNHHHHPEDQPRSNLQCSAVTVCAAQGYKLTFFPTEHGDVHFFFRQRSWTQFFLPRQERRATESRIYTELGAAVGPIAPNKKSRELP